MKNYGDKLKIWEAAALAALSFTLLLACWAQGRQGSISSELVRLHVIAVSDTEQEQRIKLQVRDAVLEYLKPKFRNISSPEAAERIIEENMSGIKKAAEAAARGRAVKAELGREAYPTREYLGFSLPAGKYESLRITLGEGKGHNWWCIVFPPLCLDAAQAQQVESVMSREDYALVSETQGYELRFKLLELWGSFSNAMDDALT